jgi:CRP/FNR family cyclic AMP-dependent transcriptional regulator
MREVRYLEENERLIQHLRNIPAFDLFEKDALSHLLKISRLVTYNPGECIIEEDGTDSWIYFLVQGKVRITKDGREVVVLNRRGDLFGEMGVIATSPRSASAVAVDKVVCLSTDFYAIEQMAESDKVMFGYLLYRIFAEILAERLKQTTKELMEFKGKTGLKFWKSE